MSPIGYADHLVVYYIKHSINDFIYFKFCKGKMKKSKIDYDEDGNAFFYVENTLKYYLNEIMRLK